MSQDTLKRYFAKHKIKKKLIKFQKRLPNNYKKDYECTFKSVKQQICKAIQTKKSISLTDECKLVGKITKVERFQSLITKLQS